MPSTTRTTCDRARPRLAGHLRLTADRVRGRPVLMGPESVLVLNPAGAAILGLCDGRRTVAEIIAELSGRYAGVSGAEVRDFLARLTARRCVELTDD